MVALFAQFPSANRLSSGAPLADPKTVYELEAALAELPPAWLILCNRHAVDGPPWVKFIALHPRKGVALIDVEPAQPETAIAPLEEFLARKGFAPFTSGDPPIVALALAKDDIAAIEDRVAGAFAEAPPCGIESALWIETVTELLMSTQGILLTRLKRASRMPPGLSGVQRQSQKDAMQGAAAKSETVQPPREPKPLIIHIERDSRAPLSVPKKAVAAKPGRNAEAPTIRIETERPPPPSPAKRSAAAYPRQHAEEPTLRFEIESPETPRPAKKPASGKRARDAKQLTLRIDMERPAPPPRPRKPASVKPAPQSEQPAMRSEPAARRVIEPSLSREPRLVVPREDWQPERTRHERSRGPWLIAASLLVIGGGLAFLYPHISAMWTRPPLVTATALPPAPTAASPPPAISSTVTASPVIAAPPPALETGATPQPANPPQDAENKIAPQPPIAAAAPPPAPAPAASPAPAQTIASLSPTESAPPTLHANPVPSSRNPVALAPLLKPAQKPAASVHPQRTKTVSARPAPPAHPTAEPQATAPNPAFANILASPENADTVTVDGTTYVRGREPQSLGTVTAPPDQDNN